MAHRPRPPAPPVYGWACRKTPVGNRCAGSGISWAEAVWNWRGVRAVVAHLLITHVPHERARPKEGERPVPQPLTSHSLVVVQARPCAISSPYLPFWCPEFQASSAPPHPPAGARLYQGQLRQTSSCRWHTGLPARWQASGPQGLGNEAFPLGPGATSSEMAMRCATSATTARTPHHFA